ncbi:Hypothetical predicted protein [Paramuricea clavata]|uniref:Uncharacterized protein n=1 Tax=Paramuricea clavata TaxID=317549 RepID=A0A6S7FNH0_PARCT|nr:Hypothetical predicted protein [Paramuricea clavata]
MIESEIVAPRSVKGVLSGKHYNRSVRVHKLIYEAMQRMRFEAFEKSLASSASNQFDWVGISVLEDSERESFTEICTSKQVNDAKRTYDTFVEKRSEENPTFALWSKYIDMVQLLLLYIRATRTSNWELHLSSLRSMIPWFFATDRVNYSRYAPCYWLEMLCLEKTHPCK